MNNTNDLLLERAREVSEAYVGTALPQVIDNLIKANDLEKLEYMINMAEADMAREYFHNYNVLEENSVF